MMTATPGRLLGPGINTDQAAEALHKLRNAPVKGADPATAASPAPATPKHPPKDPATGKFVKAEAAPDAVDTRQPTPEPEGDADDGTSQDEGDVDQPETPEGDESEYVTIPDTVDELAKIMGLDAEDLLNRETRGKDNGKEKEITLSEDLKGD